MKFCSECAGPLRLELPPGDERERHCCQRCGRVHYLNPRVVVGVLPLAPDGRVLLCRRGIQPRRGYWTLPAGFMEVEESSAEGAAREAWEEARASLELGPLLAVYDLAHISEVQLFYLGRLTNLDFAPGQESLETALFAWEQIPWAELAFPSVEWALRFYRSLEGRREFAPDRRTSPVGSVPIEREESQGEPGCEGA